MLNSLLSRNTFTALQQYVKNTALQQYVKTLLFSNALKTLLSSDMYLFISVQFEFFDNSDVDGDYDLTVTAYDGGLGVFAILPNPTVVAFTPVSRMIEGTRHAESFVAARYIFTDVIIRTCLC